MRISFSAPSKSQLASGMTKHVKKSTAMGLIIMLVLGLALPILGFLTPNLNPVQAAGNWWNEDWRYRQAINISNSTLQNNVYYQLQLDTSDTSKFNSDCSDLRFINLSGQTIPHHTVSGCTTSNTQIQLLFSSLSAGDQDIYLYYGNSQAASTNVSEPFNNLASGVTSELQLTESSPGPIAHWKFDEGYGTTAHSSSTQPSNDGSSSAMNWLTEENCVSSKCLRFDGTSNTQIATSDQPYFSPVNNALTISMWAKVPGTAPSLASGVCGGIGSYLMTKGQPGGGLYEWGLENEGNSAICLSLWNSGGSVHATARYNMKVNDDRWHYYAVVIENGENLSLYVDGKLGFETTTFLQAMSDTNTPVRIGGRHSEHYYTGDIDDPKIYSYARTQQQIQQDYVAGIQSLNQQQANLSNGLVGYWKMDEASWNGTAGEVKDVSGSNNHGVSTDGATTSVGHYGNGGQFDGVDDWITVPSSPALDFGRSDVTLSSWIKTSLTGRSQGIINYHGSSNGSSARYRFSTSASGQIRVGVYSNSSWIESGLGGSIVTDGQWHHVAATFDRDGLITVYIDGKPDKTLDISSKAGDSFTNSRLEIGLDAYTGGSYMQGGMDEARVYNRALSSIEITQLYTHAPKPVAYYDFEERSGSALYDKSGHGNTGTWSGSGQRYSMDAHRGSVGTFNTTGPNQDYVSLGNNIRVTRSGTLSAWVNTRSLSGSVKGIVGNSQAFRLEMEDYSSTGEPHYGAMLLNDSWDPVYRSVTRSVEFNRWYHVAVSRDMEGGTLKLYIDGVLVDTNTTVPIEVLSQLPWDIGRVDDSADYSGQIDEVKIYNYARTQQQILEDMQASLPGELNPVGHWKFDESDLTANSGIANLDTTNTNCQWQTNGKVKAAADCTANGYLTISNHPTNSAPSFTLSLWLNLADIYVSSAGANDNMIMGKEVYTASGFRMGIDQYGRPRFWTSQSGGNLTLASDKPLNIGQWYHLAVTYSSQTSQGSMYVDGQLVNRASGNFIPNTSSSLILNGGAGGTKRAIAVYDDFKIYSYPLSSQSILVDYNQSAATVAGNISTQPTTSGSGQSTTKSSNSADSQYCVPGSTDYCAKPAGEWRFEEKTGTVAKDSSGNGNNGTIYNGAKYAPGKHGSGLVFDGVNDYVEINPQDEINISSNAVTVSTWFKPDKDQSQYARLVHKGGSEVEYGLSFGENSTIRFLVNADGPETMYLFTTTSIADTTHWYYIVGVYDGATSKIYVDGKLIASQTNTGNITSQDGSLTIGGQAPYLSAGRTDDVRIYDYARTPAQVAWDYNNGKPVAHYKMDECQGNTIYDASGNGLHGLLNLGSSGTILAGTCSASNSAWSLGKMGKYNGSMSFDGVDDAIAVSSADQLNFGQEDFSLSAWVKMPMDSTKQVRIINKRATSGGPGNYGTGYELYIEGGQQELSLYIADSSGMHFGRASANAVKLRDDRWHHILVVFDRPAAIAKYYIDGKADGQKSLQNLSGSITNSQGLSIGKYGNNTDYFIGQIDDVQIFNYALTQTQIDTLYNGGAIRWGQ